MSAGQKKMHTKGRRVERKTKHAPLLSRPLEENTMEISDPPRTERDLNDWIFRLSYYKIISMALKQLRILDQDVRKFFEDSWTNHSRRSNVHRSPGVKGLYQFHQVLGNSLFRDSTQPFTNGSHNSCPPTSSALSTLTEHLLSTVTYESGCLICNSTRDQKHIEELKHHGDMTGEFFARQRRLVTHFQDKIHSATSPLRITDETDPLKRLKVDILAKARSTMKPFDPPDLALMGLFYHPEIYSTYAYAEIAETDCLGRTSVHQWLDSAPAKLNGQDVYTLEQGLCPDIINKTDILGRSLLHLACQRSWEEGVEALLRSDAQPHERTVYGHLPLHYAAANGSSKICNMLIKKERFTLGDVAYLDCEGNSALYYAIGSKDKATTRVLLGSAVHRNPMVVNSPYPPPFIRAIREGEPELALMLALSGVNTKVDFHGNTAEWYVENTSHSSKHPDQWLNLRNWLWNQDWCLENCN
ncbi:ankyrin repeat-containing domain protein [Pyrenochaeta sp. MPI-SDFR-AT-0127]|nr:ankyrin repeat-containing domain protein [Pyrenochaeta sp. MPI-SDFR-AT-0127]